MYLVFAALCSLIAAVKVEACADTQAYCASYSLIGACMKEEFYKQCPHSCGACVCTDALKKGECLMLREQGACLSNFAEMDRNCKATCGFCGCRDQDKTNCPVWAQQGRCFSDRNVQARCPLSCKYCGECGDNTAECEVWAAQGHCKKHPNKMLTNCAAACGLCECMDTPGMEAECATKAALGECETNILFAYSYCAATCNLCPSRGGSGSDSDSDGSNDEEEGEEEEGNVRK